MQLDVLRKHSMSNLPSVDWGAVRALGELIGGVGTAVGVMYTGFRLIPMMWDRTLLVTRCSSSEAAAREYRNSCDRLERVVEIQRQSIELLEQRNATLRLGYDEQEERFTAFTSIAGEFIIALVDNQRQLRQRLQEVGITDIPHTTPIPDELQQAVAAAKSKLLTQTRSREVSKEDYPFPLNVPEP